MCFTSLAPAASAAASSGSTWGTVAQLAPTLLAAGSKAGVAAEQASSAQSLLQYQQTNALVNAALSTQQANDIVQQGENQAVALSQKARQLKGSQRAAIAANGVRLDSGSAVNVQASTDYMRDVDLATIRNNAARAAWGQQVTTSSYQGRAAALGAGAQAQSPLASGFSSLLGSAPGVAGKWYDLYKNGGNSATVDRSFDNPSDYG